MSYLVSDLITRRFWQKVKKTDSCWVWIGAGKRYGNFTAHYKQYGAHRFAYELFKGSISQGHQIDHLCKNTKCVNPEHLEAVTAHENNKRSTSPSAKNLVKTHCSRGHEFNEKNTRFWKDKRLCRICQRENVKKLYYRKKLNVVSC